MNVQPMKPEVGRFYLAYVTFPIILNDDSPAASPANGGFPLVLDIPQERKKPKRLEFRTCLVTNYDDTTNVATILLSTKGPHKPHRYTPSPPPGYLNFTHLFKVQVLTLDTAKEVVGVIPTTTPGAIALANIKEKTRNAVLKITLAAPEFANVRTLHDQYRAGVRYTAEGDVIAPDSGFGNLDAGSGPHSEDTHTRDKNEQNDTTTTAYREMDGSGMPGEEWAELVRRAMAQEMEDQEQRLGHMVDQGMPEVVDQGSSEEIDEARQSDDPLRGVFIPLACGREDFLSDAADVDSLVADFERAGILRV
ncbi:hypothetical protein HK104_006981 [Borealophlyctis nickersoniae]|nr:hypothetical protein HK104_006981 [Borealophlyctis nickersoniae]